jgi:hypothetical protein
MPVIIQEPSKFNFSNNLNPFVMLGIGTYSTLFTTSLKVIKPNGEIKSYGLLTPPNTNSEFVFDPSYIIRDYIDDDINFNTTLITPATSSIVSYKMVSQSGFSFGFLGTTISIVDVYTSSNYLVINAEKPHLEYRKTNPYDYVMGVTSNGKFLTNSPEKDIDLGEWETLSLMYLKPSGTTYSFGYALVTGKDSDGVPTTYETIPNFNSVISNTYSATFSNFQKARLDLPVGTQNIENIFGTSSLILDDSTTSYDVQLFGMTSSANITPAGIDVKFIGFATEGQSFSITHNSNVETFTFKDNPDVPVYDPYSLLFNYDPFIDDWVNNYILEKFAEIFGAYGYSCELVDAGASEASIRITTLTDDITFTVETIPSVVSGINETVLDVGNTIPNVNFITDGNKGTFEKGIHGITCDQDNIISWDGLEKKLVVYTDDTNSPFEITIHTQKLLPNTVYKYSITVENPLQGGATDPLDLLMNYSGISSLTTAPVIYPHAQEQSRTYVLFFRTNLSVDGNIKLQYTYTDSMLDRIAFYISNTSLEIVGSSIPLSEIKTFNKKKICWRYDKQRVMWLNSYGAYDYFTFQSITNGTTEVSKNMYRNPLPYNYSDRDRMDKIYNVSYTKTHSLNTGTINRNTIYWLEDLYKSTKVFLMNGEDLIPVTITSDSYDRYIKGRDRVVSFDIDMVEAIKNNGIR